MATLAPTLSFCGVLSESKRIINAHSRHFLALAVLFLLPLSFSIIIYPTLRTTLSESGAKHTKILLGHTHSHNTTTPDYSLKTLAFPLIYTLFVFFVSLGAVGTVTYSTYHGFYGRPVKLVAAIKSLVHSFIPLVVTTIASQIVAVLVCTAFVLFLGLVTKGVELLGFEINYNSNYFLGFSVALSIILVLVLLHLQVNWVLACVIVVVESKWGFEPLRRSTHLVKGKRAVSLSLLLYFGTVIGFFASTCSGTSSGSFSDVWNCLAFILLTVVGSSIVTMLMLHSVASHTVLYMYCKALHGELALEIAEEFAREYVSLPFDDAKVPHVVFVAQA